MSNFAAGAAKRLLLEILGWTVLTLGVLALFLPGPGLVLTFAGLAILSTQYTWARRVTTPVKIKAWRGAAEGVETIPRIILSALATLFVSASGALWIWSPPAPAWWPVRDEWWLYGGNAVGFTLIGSSLLGLAMLAFAVHRFYRKPEAVAAIGQMEALHKVRAAARKEARRRLRALSAGQDEPPQEHDRVVVARSSNDAA